MRSIILDKICNDIDDTPYGDFDSMPEYIESTLNVDKELYKYISLENNSGFIENIIRDNSIKYGAPNEFNDPFECMSIIGISSLNTVKKQIDKLSRDTDKTYSDGAVLRAYDEIVSHSLNSYRTKSLAKYGILCLSGIWDDILMWAHYSNDHKGIIAVFQFYKDHNFYERMMKVQYVRGISYFEMEHANCEKKIWESFSTKDLIWEYENEYRVINSPSTPNIYDRNGIKPFPRELLKGFIFGCRISKDVRKDIIEMRSKYYPTLELFDIILDDSEIKLLKVPVD